jgi:DDE family transposase
MFAILSTPLAAPVILASSLRRGNVKSGHGCAHMLTRAVATARRAGVRSRILARADSAFYRHDLIAAMLKANMWFSITAPMNAAVKTAIASIPDDAWTTIRYPHAVWDEQLGEWVSAAEVAEISFTAFTSKKKTAQVTCRLVVRRVKRHQPLASDGSLQGELFAVHRHHAFITNSELGLVEADERHRDHAIVEQVIAELKDGPLAHLPSGSYPANAAWVAHAVMAFNLTRATGVLAGNRHAKARWATLRTRLINLPARVATRARRMVLHLPTDWPWAEAWQNLWTAATAQGPPPLATP